MTDAAGPELEGWADRMEGVIAGLPGGVIRRVGVVRETSSTQDLADRMSAGGGGLLLVAGQQTRGRGRFGRAWDQGAGRGVASTLTLDARAHAVDLIAIRAGLAACKACEAALEGRRLGLRWPNDVVEGEGPRGGRKLAGVLVERRGEVLLVGVGINVGQRDGDWSAELAGRAVSLAQLGSRASRIEVIERLMRALDETLTADAARVTRRWQDRDALGGQRCAFMVGGERVEGVVMGIAPSARLTIRMDDGRMVSIDARSATLVGSA